MWLFCVAAVPWGWFGFSCQIRFSLAKSAWRISMRNQNLIGRISIGDCPGWSGWSLSYARRSPGQSCGQSKRPVFLPILHGWCTGWKIVKNSGKMEETGGKLWKTTLNGRNKWMASLEKPRSSRKPLRKWGNCRKEPLEKPYERRKRFEKKSCNGGKATLWKS